MDERVGMDGRYSWEAQRLICLAGSSWSYDVSSERLGELCGLKVSDTTIRRISQEHGGQANEWMRTQPQAVREFREADGDIEFMTDGTSVNTTGGWREMKLGIFSKRDRAAPATPDEWESRTLPKPKVRVPFAAIEKSEDFGRRWKAWRRRLGLPDASAITVLADGAKWIWEEQRQHLQGADGMLDIFHAWQYLCDLSKTLHEDPEQRALWTDQARTVLPESGWSGIDALLVELATHIGDAQQQPIEEVRNGLASHQPHLNYADRLTAGQSIGSGQAEGGCKNRIGRRLKQTGVRWRVRRANRMAGLCSLIDSHQWQTT